MQDDFELERILKELKKAKPSERRELKLNFSDKFVENLVDNSEKDITLGEYLQNQSEQEELFPKEKLYGLLDDLDEELMMEHDDPELEKYDLNSRDRSEISKPLFISKKNKPRQSNDKRIKSYANSHAKLAKESSMRPLSLKKYQAD